MTDDLKQKTAARLTHRHLLGIEGLSVLEMRSLLHRSVYFADVLEKVSGGNMKIKMFEPGELMPAFDIHQAVSDGQVQAGYTCGAYLGGSLKEAIPYCTMPFGPEPHVMLGWLYEGQRHKTLGKVL